MFLESALSLEELGQRSKALLALRKAGEINPHNPQCALLLEKLLPETD
jgi:cytochrome c-type biogenesis protein CcmH/NrfG